jgi:hypothetical protein
MKLPKIEQYEPGADWRTGGEVESQPDRPFAQVADTEELRDWHRPMVGRRRPARARGLLIPSGPPQANTAGNFPGVFAVKSATVPREVEPLATGGGDPPAPIEREEAGEVERLTAELERVTKQRDALADALGLRVL